MNTAVQVTPLSTPANGSVTAAPVTSLGPLFAIAIVYDTNWPATTGLTVTLSSDRSTSCTTSMSKVAVLFLGLGSNVLVVTTALFVSVPCGVLAGTVYWAVNVADALPASVPIVHVKLPVTGSGAVNVPTLGTMVPGTKPAGHVSATTTLFAADVLVLVTVMVNV